MNRRKKQTVLWGMTAVLLLSCFACAAPPAEETESRGETESSQPTVDESREESQAEPEAELDYTRLKEPLALPESSRICSDMLAEQALLLCTGHSMGKERTLLEQAGFRVLVQKNYDKTTEDSSHTCAWTAASRRIEYQGRPRTVIVLAIRGTQDGEWNSNFDFDPSHSGESQAAGNFLFAAEDIFLSVLTLAAEDEEPLFLVCGHSRGAACANWLGVLLNAQYGTERVFTYTFATPATWRESQAEWNDENIFNWINPEDPVPQVPLAAWEYRRFGTDIVLAGNAERETELQKTIRILEELAPTPEQYYKERHSLTQAGLAEDGMTCFEFMLLLTSLVRASGSNGEAGRLAAIAADSDFAPLLQRLEEILQEDGSAALQPHSPAVYQRLIQERVAEANGKAKGIY